jgi:hypothetical protein
MTPLIFRYHLPLKRNCLDVALAVKSQVPFLVFCSINDALKTIQAISKRKGEGTEHVLIRLLPPPQSTPLMMGAHRYSHEPTGGINYCKTRKEGGREW